MLATGFNNGAFTVQFGLAVNVKWCSLLGLATGRVSGAVKDVVGGVMNQPCAKFARLICQKFGAFSVDGGGKLWLFLRIVDGRVSRCVDNDVGSNGLHRPD